VDSRAAEARRHHQAAQESRRRAAQHLAQRDALVRALYAEGGWSYATLAKAVDCTPELIAKIIKPQR
jgi:ribosome-binding protein aMBF1 (putative translation factor)